MGTEILRPQDCLIGRIRDSPAALQRRRCNYGSFNANQGNYYSSNPKINRRSVARPDQRKQFASGTNQNREKILKRASADDLRKPRNGLEMENVTILRRGDSFDSKIKSSQASLRKVSDCYADSKITPKQVRFVEEVIIPMTGRCDMYAGSGFSVSPAPSSLPFPSFSKKKEVLVDDSATRDLRRLLGLDL